MHSLLQSPDIIKPNPSLDETCCVLAGIPPIEPCHCPSHCMAPVIMGKQTACLKYTARYPSVSSSWGAVGPMIDALRKRNVIITSTSMPHLCVVRVSNRTEYYEATHEHGPMAICLAVAGFAQRLDRMMKGTPE